MQWLLFTLIGIVESFNERDDSAFPRTATTNDSDRLPGREENGEIPEDHHVRPWWVAKGDIFKLNVAIDFTQTLPI